jgi:hypothetical protein
MMVGSAGTILFLENMTYVGCDDGSIRCVCPSGKDIALENYIICKPHSDSVKKVELDGDDEI